MICLMPMCAYLSETSRMIQIYKALRARGAEVCMATHGGVHEALIAAEGIAYDIVGPHMDEARGRRFILDNVGNRSLAENRRVLKPDGRYVLIGGGGPDNGRWIGPMIKPIGAAVTSWFVSQHMGMVLAELNQKDLNELARLMADGKVTPVIDRTYPLEELPDAIRYLESSRARGKVIITVP